MATFPIRTDDLFNPVWRVIRRAWWGALFRRHIPRVSYYGHGISVGSFVEIDGEQHVALVVDDVVRAALSIEGARKISADLASWADTVEENNKNKKFQPSEKIVLQYIVEAISDAAAEKATATWQELKPPLSPSITGDDQQQQQRK